MGGHGGINILHHKPWHVYNRENIDRVERDERAHREREAQRENAEAEARMHSTYAMLRNRTEEQVTLPKVDIRERATGDQGEKVEQIENPQPISTESRLNDVTLGDTFKKNNLQGRWYKLIPQKLELMPLPEYRDISRDTKDKKEKKEK